MIRVEASVTIDRPVDDVARYLADIERMTEWPLFRGEIARNEAGEVTRLKARVEAAAAT